MPTTRAPAGKAQQTRPAASSVDLVKRAEQVAARAHRLQTMLNTINAERREVIAQLVEQGCSQNVIARLLDLSRQRVSQYVAELQESGRLPTE